MEIQQFEVGDYFHTDRNERPVQIKIKEIRCAFVSARNRWETDVVFDECDNGIVIPKLVLKMVAFVEMIREKCFVRKYESLIRFRKLFEKVAKLALRSGIVGWESNKFTPYGGYGVQIKSISVGDVFIHENGTKIRVRKISCAYEEKESRWETSVVYDTIHPRLPTLSNENVVAKARDFVILIQATDSGFVTHIQGSTEISFTPGGDSTANRPGPSQIEQDFFRFARKYGMQASDLHREVTIATNGSPRKYKIAGINPRNHKYPILCRKLRTGTLYKFQADRVKNSLV